MRFAGRPCGGVRKGWLGYNAARSKMDDLDTSHKRRTRRGAPLGGMS